MTQRLIRRRELEQLVGLSKSAIYSKLDAKSPYHDAAFPRPVRLGQRAVAWRLEDIEAWLDSREAGGAA